MERRDVTEQKICELAYTLWEANGRPEGSSNRYWDQAELQLQDQNNDKKLTSPLGP